MTKINQRASLLVVVALTAAAAALVAACGTAANANPNDPCDPDYVLVGDICDKRDNYTKEQLEVLDARSELDLRCESIESAGGVPPAECAGDGDITEPSTGSGSICGEGFVLVGDTCDDRENYTAEQLEEFDARNELDLRCESIESAGGTLPEECAELGYDS